jgi:hypothetical protein
MKKLLLVLGAALGLACASNSASATALSYPGGLRDALLSPNMETVHWRGYVHCHVGRYGNRYCHGGPARRYVAPRVYVAPRRYVAPRVYVAPRRYVAPRVYVAPRRYVGPRYRRR